MLLREKRMRPYMALLRGAHRDDNLAHVTCRGRVSAIWRGYVCGCDFNQMLDTPADAASGHPHLRELLDAGFENAPIAIGEHCYGCTAGRAVAVAARSTERLDDG